MAVGFPDLQSKLVHTQGPQTGMVTPAWYRLFLRLLNQTGPGTIVIYGGASAPSNTLLCNGAAVSRSTYANLFGAIGITFGPGDGTTTFNIPNIAAVVAGARYYVYT